MPAAKIPRVTVENRSNSPLTMELKPGTLDAKYHKYEKLDFGDPADAGRVGELNGKEIEAPQPELTLPLIVWEAYEDQYENFINGLLDTKELRVRAVA